MRSTFTTLILAAAVLVLAPAAHSQNSETAKKSKGGHEAVQMVPATAKLLRPVDAKKDQTGATVEAKLTKKVVLTDGTKLPSGTVLTGQVAPLDNQSAESTSLALRFDQARLDDGTMVKVKATIVGFYGPGRNTYEDPVAEEPLPIPNTWNDGTLELDQTGVSPGIDLHSRIASPNSGVFVSPTKDNIVLKKGSEIQFAIGPDVMGATSVTGS